MNYYHNLVTQKSWTELTLLKRRLNFVLIGGWAVYLYTQTLKSKDIDIIVDFTELSRLKEYYPIYKNDRLKKYEAVNGEVQIDIYLPYFSNLGLPVEVLLRETQTIDGFTVVTIEYLLAMKLFTLSRRGRSPKGRKDFLDILSLLTHTIDGTQKLSKIIKMYHLQSLCTVFQEFLHETTKIPELNLNSHQFAKIKQKIALLLAV